LAIMPDYVFSPLASESPIKGSVPPKNSVLLMAVVIPPEERKAQAVRSPA
jgi:hypothetical protein